VSKNCPLHTKRSALGAYDPRMAAYMSAQSVLSSVLV